MRGPAGGKWSAFALVTLAMAACTRSPAPSAIHSRNDAKQYGGAAAHAFAADTVVTAIRPGGLEPRTKPSVAMAVAPSGATVLVRYLGGCEWLDDVAVAETDETVSITVRVARPAGKAADDPCLDGRYHVARVTLRQPLRGRLMVDGSDNQARPVVRLEREP